MGAVCFRDWVELIVGVWTLCLVELRLVCQRWLE